MRSIRAHHPEPTYIPTPYLKSRWRAWNPPGNYGRIAKPSASYNRDSSIPMESSDTSYNPSSAQINTSSRSSNLDHRFSVRSIATLPPYHVAPLENEHVIAREGERAGVDTVIEFPETEAELEAQREEEMQTLYNIRQARRNQAAEREERRRQRREAREAGDWARLEQLEAESRARTREAITPSGVAAANGNNNQDVSLLIAELASQREARRDRRVTSVSYADLGLARHDGSRIRADSVDSDNRPLLDSAASMASSRVGSRQNSPYRSIGCPLDHRRGQSDASIISQSSSLARGADTPATRTTADEWPLRLTPQTSPEADHHSEHDGDIPTTEPPAYEDDAPPYSSPVLDRGEGPQVPFPSVTPPSPVTQQSPSDQRRQLLPPIQRLPAIEILSATPANSTPSTPVVARQDGMER